jgi:hypothetical protein
MRDSAAAMDILNRIVVRTVGLGRDLPSEADLVASILVRLPRISTCIGRGDAAVGDLIDSLIREVNGLVTRAPEHSDFVIQMMADLNELGLVCDIWHRPDTPVQQQPQAPTEQRRTGEGIQYFRRKGPDDQMVLVESRPLGKARDFYVRRSEYDRAAKILSDTAVKEGVKFPKLYETFAVNHEPSEYVLRVILRFWRTSAPALITRERSRYQVVGAATKFRMAVGKAWDELPLQ